MRGEGLGQIIRVTLRTQGRGCLAHGHGRKLCTISRTLGPTLAFKNMSHPTDPQQRKAMEGLLVSALRLQKREGGKEGGRYVMEQSKRNTWNSTPLSWMRS